MISRRRVLGFATSAVLALKYGHAFAQDWKSAYQELVLGMTPVENPGDIEERFGALAEYLTRELGVPVKLRTAATYAGVIDGQREGQIHIAYYGPASYALAYLTGVETEPFAVEVIIDGSRVHHSVFYVKRESRFEKIEDLKGMTLALVDPDSMAGSIVPHFELSKRGIEPEKFFSKIVYTGSHENAILALKKGTADICANRWSNDGDSVLRRMEDSGVPGVKYDDYRIIHTSGPIPNAPIAYLSNLPAGLKKAIREAFFNIEMKDKYAFDKFAGGKFLPWEPVANKEYEPVIALVKSMDGPLAKPKGTEPAIAVRASASHQ